MKNGDKFLFITGMFILGCIIANSNSKKTIKILSDQPSLLQYMNRLIEFYDSDDVYNMKQEFLKLVDFGLSAKSAFYAMTENGDSN